MSCLRSLLVEDIRRANLRPGNGKLLMLVGLPGSGKTTFARSLASLHPFLVLESDRLRKTLVPKPEYSADEHSRVFRASHRLIDEFLDSGYQVLLDATNLGQRNRRPVIAISRKHGIPLAIVVVTAPPEVIRRRLLEREAGNDPDTWSDAGYDVYLRMASAWQPVNGPLMEVDTSQDSNSGLQRVLQWARS